MDQQSRRVLIHSKSFAVDVMTCSDMPLGPHLELLASFLVGEVIMCPSGSLFAHAYADFVW